MNTPLLPLLLLTAMALPLRADLDDHAGSDAFAAEAAALTPAFVPTAAQLAAPDPATCQGNGAWGPVLPWAPHIPVTCAQLPDGRLLTFASNQRTTFPNGAEFTYAATWDYRTGQFVEINNPRHDMFCGGVALLPDGRLLVNGGRKTTRLSSMFDWRTNQWSAVPNMVDPRWYNTSVALPNGEVFTASGSGGSDTAERWNESSGWTRLTGINWRNAHAEGGLESIWHPFLHLAPSGQISHTGPTDSMHWVNWQGSGSFPDTGVDVPGSYYPKDGAVVMFDEGKILLAGGRTLSGGTSNLAYVVDVNGSTPTITPTASLRFARTFANGVVLPNGEVMVIGGNNSTQKFSDVGSVLVPEIWNPQTGQWRSVATAQVPRNYHSLAALLPDGTVWSGGGGLSGNSADHRDAQVFTPGCLFNANGTAATRPVISQAPATLAPGLVFEVRATPGMRNFTLIKLSSLTHSVTSDLRFLNLPFSETSAGVYAVQGHPNLNVMTPGYWMLFAVSAEGPFSVSKTLRVSADNVPVVGAPGDQRTAVGRSVALQIIANGTGTLSYTASNLPDGLSIQAATGRISGVVGGVPGVKRVTVSVTSSLGPTATQAFDWTVLPETAGEGTILREWWLNVGGSGLGGLLADARYPNNPTGSELLTSFEGPTDWEDQYGSRVRGYLHPLVTGQYRFWVASDDQSELRLSTDATVGGSRVIAQVSQWTSPRQWDKFAEQRSALITLQAGQKYYIEALMREGGVGDHLAVAWAVPGTTTPVVITGDFLSPWRNNTAPVVTTPGTKTSVAGFASSLAIQASDVNSDALTFAATNLPAGLAIQATTGIISGTATTAGTKRVTVSVTDGVNPAVNVSFDWVVLPPMTVAALSGGPIPVNQAATFTAVIAGGLNVQTKWSLGDGSPETLFTPATSISHTYAVPGLYTLRLTVRDDTGTQIVRSFTQAVHAPLTGTAPTQSSAIAYQSRGAGNDRLWVVNPDNDSVSVFDAVTRGRLAEINVGIGPRCVAIAPDGRAWVTNTESSSVTIVGANLEGAETLPLARGGRPFGVVFNPAGTAAYVALEDGGAVLKLNPVTGAVLGSAAVAGVRHLSVSADGTRVYASRFITPRLPGEETATIPNGAAGAEVVVLAGSGHTVERTMRLRLSTAQDTSLSSRGVPNYLGAPALSPDGRSAWIPSKQDNVQRGVLRDGKALVHDMSVRAIASRIDLGTQAEDYASRLDFDNAGMPSAMVFDRSGAYAFVALESSRTVSVMNPADSTELQRIDVGRAPQGLALSADGRTLFVQNFMDRSVSVIELTTLLAGDPAPLAVSATLNTVSAEKLTPTVLNGKQLFYDAKDNRLALQEYISCAACHNDGGHDGRVWDFTGVGEGLRNTITLRGHGGTKQGALHWTGNFDEVQDFENQIRLFAGGLGLINGLPHAPLAAEKNGGRSADLDALAAYLGSLTRSGQSPRRQANGALTAAAVAGQAVFAQQNCASCHGGPEFTISELNVFADVGTVKATTGRRLNGLLPGLDVPTLRGLWSTAPYLHDGSAATLEGAVLAHRDVVLSTADLSNLVAYLMQIDDQEVLPPVPALAAAPLASVDVGVVGAGTGTGYVAETATFFIKGAGSDVFFAEDGFRFVYQTLDGDGEIIARVTSQQAGNPWAKTGVMIREGLAGGARHAMAFTTPAASGNGFGMVWRDAVDGSSAYAGGGALHAIPNNWVRLVRTGDVLTGYQSSDGVSWRVISTTTLTGLPEQLHYGLAVTSSDVSAVAASTLDRVTIRAVTPPSDGLNLVGVDVGNAAIVGGTVLDSSSGTYTLQGAGSDIFFAEDGFRFAQQTLTGDGEILARVTDHQAGNPWSKAGVMLREGLTGTARQATVFTTPTGAGNGFGMVWRPTVAGATQYAGGSGLKAAPNNWVRLVRTGNVVTGYTSAEGRTWTRVGSAAMAGLADTLQVGLVITSSDNGALGTASFDNVEVIKAPPPVGGPVLTGVDVGTVFTPGTTVRADSSYTLRASGADVFFDADGFHFAHIAVEGDGEVVARVSSQTNTNPWAKAGVMIRESLAAGSRHAMAFTTPTGAGNGYGMVWRPTANAATQYAGGPALNAAPDNWVRLQRQGDVVIAATSADGTAWTELSRATFVALPGTLYFGVALTAAENAQYATAVFDQVAFTDSPPAAPLAGTPGGGLGSDDGSGIGAGSGGGGGGGDLAGSGAGSLGSIPDKDLVITVPRLTLARLEDGRLSASYRRSPGSAVRVALQGLQELRQSPVGWREMAVEPAVTLLEDGTERVEYTGIGQASFFAGAREGFVRLQAEVDLDGDGFAETLNHGETLGWARRSFGAGDQTFGVPFVPPLAFRSVILGVEENALSIFGAGLGSGAAYYAEIHGGDHSGHRFELDEAASTATRLVLDLDSTEARERNTLAAVPTGLRGVTVAVRAHQTVNAAFPVHAFSPGRRSELSDRLLRYREGVYEVLWLIDLPTGPRWVVAGDATLADQGQQVLNPGEGVLLRARSATGEVWMTGAVREVPMALVARAGTTMIANPWPTAASPASLGLTETRGFTGGTRSTGATRMMTWKADRTPGAAGFETWFLLASGSYHQWIASSDASLTDVTRRELLQPLQAAFLTLPVAPTAVTLPVPWQP